VSSARAAAEKLPALTTARKVRMLSSVSKRSLPLFSSFRETRKLFA
jgi:hypothetical protein